MTKTIDHDANRLYTLLADGGLYDQIIRKR